jgi:hypothetical protein
VIERSGGTRSSSTTTTLKLQSNERRVVRRLVESGQGRVTTRVTVREGATLPETVELFDVPQTIVSEVPELREYRYFISGDDIVFVEPKSRRIVTIIE